MENQDYDRVSDLLVSTSEPCEQEDCSTPHTHTDLRGLFDMSRNLV